MNQNTNTGRPSVSPPSISLNHTLLGNAGEKVYEESMLHPVGSFEVHGSNSGSGGSMRAAIEHSKCYSNSTSPSIRGKLDSLATTSIDHISLGLPVSPSTQAMDLPTAQRRMRSSSLFSSNSIWNDDNVSVHSASNTGSNIIDAGSIHSFDISGSLSGNATANKSFSNGTFLSPMLAPESNDYGNSLGSFPQNVNLASNYQQANQPRNRSYTTTAVAPNAASPVLNYVNGYSGSGGNGAIPSKYSMLNVDASLNVFGENAMGAYDNEPVYHDLAGPLTSNNRIRSQTFSGSSPILTNQMIGSDYNSRQVEQFPGQLLYALGGNFPHGQGVSQDPVLLDDFDFNKIFISTSYDNPKMGPTDTILIDNVPEIINAFKLFNILLGSLSGPKTANLIRSVRISSSNSSKLAVVECSSIEVAMTLKANLSHIELVPGMPLYTAFAILSDNSGSGTSEIRNSKDVNKEVTTAKRQDAVIGSRVILNTLFTDIKMIEKNLINTISIISGNKDIDMKKVSSLLNSSFAFPNINYQDNFGPLPDPSPLRQFDSPRLRELRKYLDHKENSSDSLGEDDSISQTELTQLDIEDICLAMLEELPKLCYDYLGNTIVQKIYTCLESPVIRLMMVRVIAPYLTQLGIHKNGTWAIQKIFNLCHDDYRQMSIIGNNLKPYTVKLFNDQFGNYVIQCCLKFGSPYNDFIIESILDNFLEISFGRFGARCVRTILETASESDCITNEQLFLVAALIVEYAEDLVLNSNGSLLITWFLDTFPSYSTGNSVQFSMLVQKLIPNLAKFCSHKLANLTILKILNNRSDTLSKKCIMDAIFGQFDDTEEDFTRSPSQLLEEILSENADNSAGPLFIYKVLSNQLLLTLSDEPDLEKNIRYQKFVVQQIRKILLEINITNFQPYKKLMDEVGFSSNRLSKQSMPSRRSKRGGRNGMRYQGSTPNITPGAQYNKVAVPGMSMAYSMPHNHQNQKFPIPYNQHVVPTYSSGIDSAPLCSQDEHEVAMMKQLEQLSLSSAAMGYSNPGTPTMLSNNSNQYF